MADRLGPDVPLHFTAFHPDYKMRDIAAHPAGDAHPRPRARAAQRPALRLHGQRPRHRGVEHLVPGVRGARGGARLVRAGRLEPHRRRALPRLRHGGPRPVRRPARGMGPAPRPGPPASLSALGSPRSVSDGRVGDGDDVRARHDTPSARGDGPCRVRRAAVAGTFYPGDAQALRRAVADCVERRAAAPRPARHRGRHRRPRRLPLLGCHRRGRATGPWRPAGTSCAGSWSWARRTATPWAAPAWASAPRTPGRRRWARWPSTPRRPPGWWPTAWPSRPTPPTPPSTASRCSCRSCRSCSATCPCCPWWWAGPRARGRGRRRSRPCGTARRR